MNRSETMETDTLRDEIRHYEAHLARVADDDDSACGKARIRMVEVQLQQRRERLVALMSTHHAHAVLPDGP